MITAEIFRNSSGQVYGFEVNNHGKSIVCSAVSMLVINSINSVEAFTDVGFECDADEKAGHIFFRSNEIRDGTQNRDFGLLMDSLVLGLRSVAGEYGREFRLNDKHAADNKQNV